MGHYQHSDLPAMVTQCIRSSFLVHIGAEPAHSTTSITLARASRTPYTPCPDHWTPQTRPPIVAASCASASSSFASVCAVAASRRTEHQPQAQTTSRASRVFSSRGVSVLRPWTTQSRSTDTEDTGDRAVRRQRVTSRRLRPLDAHSAGLGCYTRDWSDSRPCARCLASGAASRRQVRRRRPRFTQSRDVAHTRTRDATQGKRTTRGSRPNRKFSCSSGKINNDRYLFPYGRVHVSAFFFLAASIHLIPGLT
ncbi:hypothetical protein L915_07438 [Phytophthora nicotianae]|uniref:Uncharacterized protein n=1 Tax=Phytophthora nicotianae TaxID=4792 RepID=W2H194_PHYNI|nr:hypothetical protein L915_07438 [Phytophthora nicotianae]ETL41704.1 hypothetical protein L916_07380 [Phytophthora nicotianae]